MEKIERKKKGNRILSIDPIYGCNMKNNSNGCKTEFTCVSVKELNYEKCKERLFLRLVNRDWNHNLWEITNFEPWNDLALTVRCYLKNGKEGLISFLVTKEHIKHWGVTWKEVFEIAKENTPKLFPYRIYEYTAFSAIFATAISRSSGKNIPVMEHYMLTNEQGMNGATTIIYPEVLEEFKERFTCDLYLMPSSIHEFMICFDDGRLTPDGIREIIKDANGSVVEEHEVLSYQVYRWNHKTGEVTICK